MSKKENIMTFYYMPRDLAKYGAQFCIEYVPENHGHKEYYNTFIPKPEWCKDFDAIYAGGHKHNIVNFTIKGIKFVSIDGIVSNALPDKERADEYRDLEKKLGRAGVEQELAQSEGRWHKYMEDHVESLESLKARGKDVTESN